MLAGVRGPRVQRPWRARERASHTRACVRVCVRACLRAPAVCPDVRSGTHEVWLWTAEGGALVRKMTGPGAGISAFAVGHVRWLPV